MSGAINDGGPAFPFEEKNDDGSHYHGAPGMTLRDYFMAHAPAEPQSWFKPAMPAPPEAPSAPKNMTDEERHEWGSVGEYSDYEGCTSPRIRAYGLAYKGWWKADHAWGLIQEKQRHIQWPAAWADEMLQQRGVS